MPIDSIIIETRNIYNLDDPRYDNFLFRTANRLHIVTKSGAVRRELLFHAGEPFSADAAEETARNLRTRLAVNTAWIEPERLPNGHLRVRVITVDQWSLLASLDIAREGYGTNYRIGFEERNFLGNHQFWSFDYSVQARDDNFHVATFRDSRFLGLPMQVVFTDQNDPINSIRQVTLAHPYYNLTQRFSVSGTTASTSAREDVYREGELIAQWYDQGEFTTLNGDYRWGPRYVKIGVGGGYTYRHTGISDRRVRVGTDPTSIHFPEDSTYHLFMSSVSLSTVKFAIVSRIQRAVYPEDITLGVNLQAGYGRAFTPDFDKYYYDVVTLDGSTLQKFGSNLIGCGLAQEYQFKGARYFRRETNYSLKFYNNGLSWFTLASQARYSREWRSDGLGTLQLGGRTGIRGYDPFYRTGSSLAVLNLEGRFFSNIEVLSTMLGAVVFSDLGTVWQNDQRALSQPIYRSIGFGLRLSLEKFTKDEIFRLDVSRGQDNNWEISFGNHQYFSL